MSFVSLLNAFATRFCSGVWHSGIVLGDREYYFGGGIFVDGAGATPYGRPNKKLLLGRTNKTVEEFRQFLDRIRPRFRMQDYDLIRHNCNNFTDECAKFLLDGKGIPQDILDLPTRALSTPLGQMLLPQIDAYRQSMVQAYSGVDAAITRQAENNNNVNNGTALDASNPHALLDVPLFRLGAPVANDTGGPDKAVERLQVLLQQAGKPELITPKLASLMTVRSCADFLVAFAADDLCSALVLDLVDALRALAEPDRYPVFDALRVACLHAKGRQVALEQCGDELTRAIFQSTSKLTRMAALRLLQNFLLEPKSKLSFAPLDISTSEFIGSSLSSEHQPVRKAAVFAAYNFSLALERKDGEDEALVMVLSSLANYIQTPKEGLASFETLSALLSFGNLLYGRIKMVALFRNRFSKDVSLEQYKASPMPEIKATVAQIEMLLNV